MFIDWKKEYSDCYIENYSYYTYDCICIHLFKWSWDREWRINFELDTYSQYRIGKSNFGFLMSEIRNTNLSPRDIRKIDRIFRIACIYDKFLNTPMLRYKYTSNSDVVISGYYKEFFIKNSHMSTWKFIRLKILKLWFLFLYDKLDDSLFSRFSYLVN